MQKWIFLKKKLRKKSVYSLLKININIIHGWFMNRMIPTTWVLMNNRVMKDYNFVLMALKTVAHRYGLSLAPKTIMIDFEVAAMNSFRENFHGIVGRGCHFFPFFPSYFQELLYFYLFWELYRDTIISEPECYTYSCAR